MSRKRLLSKEKGFLVRASVDLMIFAETAEEASKEGLDQLHEQLSYTGYEQHELAMPVTSQRFYGSKGESTHVELVEELCIAPDAARRANGVWARVRETKEA